MSPLDVMAEGYRDGFADHRPDYPHATNREPEYVHGWLNGRDDRIGSPRATADELRIRAGHILSTGEPS